MTRGKLPSRKRKSEALIASMLSKRTQSKCCNVVASTEDIEGIASIDEREKESIAGRFQQTVNEQSRAGAHIRADDSGDRAFAEAAIGRSSKKGDTNLAAGMSGRMLKALGKRLRRSII